MSNRTGITFAVDDVSPATDRPAVVADAVATALGGAPLAQSAELDDLVAVADRPGLLLAVELAYNQHRPLVLTPDAVWLTIAHGFARHVSGNAEKLRKRFVRHDGKKVVRVQSDALDAASAWEGAIDAFADALETELGGGLVRLMTCTFSTTTAATRTASRVVLMDAFKKYFDYEIMAVCGIPRVQLAGTVEDWRDIRRRLDVLAEFDLEWWVAPLRPVADEWVRTAEGKPDVDFWQCIYKSSETYGGALVCGWIARLFPYFDAAGTRRNEVEPYEEPSRWPGVVEAIAKVFIKPDPARLKWLSRGIGSKQVEGGLSRVPVRCVGVGGDRICTAVAGVFGPAVDDEGFVHARAGWAAREDPISALFERLQEKHTLRPLPADRAHRHDPMPALLIQLYDLGDGVTFHGGRVVIRERARIEMGQLGNHWGPVFADLSDGSRLLWCKIYGEGPVHERVYKLPKEGNEGAVEVAQSMLEVLQRLTDEEQSFL